MQTFKILDLSLSIAEQIELKSMTRKYHNNTLQTNPLHREEEPGTEHYTQDIRKTTSSLFLINMIA